jgi:transketolase
VAEIPEDKDYRARATRIRRHVVRMTHEAKTSHVGTSLSMADLLAVLYGGILRVDPKNPAWPDRDRLVMSKGHGAAGAYAALAEAGFFSLDWLLAKYCRDGTYLAGHISHTGVPGVDASTGSLGHGLSIACGMALAGRRDARPYRVFALLSDGECDEGSTWEAVLFAPHHALDNLVAIVDYNKIQSLGRVDEVLELEPFADKWRSFRWAVREIDGHDFAQIRAALTNLPAEPGRPTCIIAHTVKGKGVSFMEDKLAWHYQAPTAEEFENALAELERAG